MVRADDYPSRPVRLVVGFAAGGAADIVARLIGQWLSQRLHQSFIIENRPGAGSNTAAEAVIKAPPDGYTLLHVTVSNAINQTLYEKLTLDIRRDIAPVASVYGSPGVLVINPAVPAATVAELIDYAKARPGQINMGSAGNGSPQHLYGELFKSMTGVALVHVPYRAYPNALADLIGGQLQVMFDALASSIEHIKAGRLRALAVTTAARSPALPDIPTVGEFVPGYEASGWQGIGAPRGTPAEIIDRLNREIMAGLADPQMTARIAGLGGVALPGTPADFGNLIAADIAKWGAVVKRAGIMVE
ncbi:MAG TPA: tripartite tricarboxylate transporter substrate binding protein [Xanthobacteraceae bacterium]|jgi:tripartite-type tricarboxylate transporter receptor subunit TctC